MAGIAPSVNNIPIAAPAPTPAAPLGEPASSASGLPTTGPPSDSIGAGTSAPSMSAPSKPDAVSDAGIASSAPSQPQQNNLNSSSGVSAAAASKPLAPEGAGPDLHPPAPKPVEVTSVPQTPINDGTPAGGSPRPELKLTSESQRATPQPAEAPVILGPGDSAHKAKEASEPVTDSGAPNGIGISGAPAVATAVQPTGASTDPASSTTTATTAHAAVAADSEPVTAPPPAAETSLSSTAGIGQKRKAEDDGHPNETPAANGGASAAVASEQDNKATLDNDRPQKKAKLTDKIKSKVSEVKEKITHRGGSDDASKGKSAGRPKKDKKAPPPVGRTQRKTRSQGPADGMSG